MAGKRNSKSGSGSGERGRWSSKKKMDVVLRLLKGEDLDALSRECRVTASTISKWRDDFLEAGQSGLKTRPSTPAEDETQRLKAKVGELMMEYELLWEKSRELEKTNPFPWRKSKG
jgi:transposase-like protein